MSSKSALAGLLAITACVMALTGCVHRTLLNDLPEKAIPGISGISSSSPEQKAIAIRRAIEKGGVTAQTIVTETEKIAVRKDTNIWLVKSNATDMLLVPVSRKLGAASVQTAVKALLDGPYDEESKHGLGSEIPRGTVLLGVDETDKQIEINLSKRFASGGGTDSIETRLEQLSKTVRPIAGDKPVYLNVESKRLTMTPGEGIEVRHPSTANERLAQAKSEAIAKLAHLPLSSKGRFSCKIDDSSRFYLKLRDKHEFPSPNFHPNKTKRFHPRHNRRGSQVRQTY